MWKVFMIPDFYIDFRSYTIQKSHDFFTVLVFHRIFEDSRNWSISSRDKINLVRVRMANFPAGRSLHKGLLLFPISFTFFFLFFSRSENWLSLASFMKSFWFFWWRKERNSSNKVYIFEISLKILIPLFI